GARLAVDTRNDTDRVLAVDTAGRQLDQNPARRPPWPRRAARLGTPPLAPGGGLGERTAGTSPPPGWNRRVRRPPRPGVLAGQGAGGPPRAPGRRPHRGQATGWASSCTSWTRPGTGDQPATRP